MKTMKETDFSFCVVVFADGVSIFFINGVRVGNYNSVGVKMGVFI